MLVAEYRIVGKFDRGILMDADFSNIFLTENILTDGHCLLPNTVLP